MGDFFGFLVFLVVLTPIVIIVMLASLMGKQNRQQEALLKLFDKLDQLANDQGKILRKLSASPETLTETQTDSEAKTIPSESEKIQKSSEPFIKAAAESFAKPKAALETKPADQGWEKQPVDIEPPPPATPRIPSRFELAAKQISKEIWNWIIVGDSHRPQVVSMEYAVASNWLLRIGVLILVTGIGFFLKYSIDNGLLGEQARVGLTVLAGLAMIIGAIRLLGGRYHLLAQGMLGGGVTVLYFSVFAAFSFYHLISAYSAFALMVVVTASAIVLAVKLNSILVAIFAIIGGYCTPILLSTGQVNFIGLYSYMLVLGVGILAVNGYKHWHLLNFLSFAFHYLLFFGSLGKFEPRYLWEILPFLIAFFILYSTMTFLFCLLNKVKSSLLDFLALIINAAIFFITARHLILTEYGSIWVGAITIALAVFYLAHVYYCLVKRISDRELLLSFISLAAFFTAITLPIILSNQWITASWAIQAAIMLWLSGKLRSAFLQQVAYLLYGIVLFRFCFIDLANQYGSAAGLTQTWSVFLWDLFQRFLSFGIPIASLAAAYFLIQKPVKSSALVFAPNNDVPLWIKNNRLVQILGLLIAAIIFIVLQLELYRSFAFLYPPLQLPLLTLVWLSACVLLLGYYHKTQEQKVLAVIQFFLLIILIKLLFIDLSSWDFTFHLSAIEHNIPSFHYRGAYRFQSALMRLVDFAAIIAFLIFAYRRLSDSAEQQIRRLFAGTALVLLFVFLSLEVNSLLFQTIPGLRSGGVSILWAAFALSLIFFGIQRQFKILRLVGLSLFAVVAYKVFFIDLARLEQVYRILAFMILGLVILGGAYFYMRYQHAFVAEINKEEKKQ